MRNSKNEWNEFLANNESEMSERTKNQLKQASSILLITDFQDFYTFYRIHIFLSFFFSFFFYYGEQNPYRAERMDGLYIGAVHYCKTHVNPPSQILSMLYPLAFRLYVIGFSVCVSDRSRGFYVLRIC